MKHKKGQAAFEYLTTYGWVIMFVLIGIGAILYFDLGGMVSILPERCWFGSQLVCEDYSVTNIGSTQTQVTFRLTNRFEEGIQIVSVSHIEAGKTLSGCSTPMIGAKETREISCILTPPLSRRDKGSVPIEIVFRDNESASKPNHTLKGEILALVS